MNDFFANLDSLARVGLSVVLVAVAAAISRWQKADLEKDIFIAVVRSFIQLIAVGYALEIVFQVDHPLLTLAITGVQLLIAAWTSGNRAKRTPNGHLIALVSIFIGTALTLTTLVVLGVFAFEPSDVVPIGGMIIGNAMATCTLVVTNLSKDLIDQRNLVETKLALGADSREATRGQLRRAIRNGMVRIIDTTKTIGLIKLPGAMTGMILAGASPLQAVQLQMIVMYMLIGANAFTGLTAAYLVYKAFFTPYEQLKAVSGG
jgi:putative ABC transport system permease protein